MVLDFKALEPLFRWEDTFYEEYHRKRNSRSKTKNIRCFPGCCAVHNASGFCGRSVLVSLEDFPDVFQLLNVGSEYRVENLFARAMFLTEPQYHAWCKRKDIVSLEKQQLLQDMRCAVDPRLPFIPVRITQDSEKHLTFRINPKLLGWHYDWRSNKSTADLKHVMALFLYIRLDNESPLYSLLGVSCSPKFIVRSGMKPTTVSKAVIKMEETGGKRKSPDRKSIFGFESVDSPAEVLTRQKVDSKLFEELKEDAAENEHSEEISLKSLLLQTVSEAKKGILKNSNEDVTIGLDDNALMSIFQEITSDWVPSAHDIQVQTENLDSFSSEASSIQTCDTTDATCSDFGETGGSKLAFALENGALKQIVKSLQGNALTEELSGFFRECATGHFGSSLCETLMEKDCVTILEESPFVREFATSLFRKFQTIISKNIWRDLYDKGIVSKPWAEVASGKIRGSVMSNYEASISKPKKQNPLLYNASDSASILRFLELLKRHYSSPDLIDKIYTTDTVNDPFAPINKCWVCADNKNDVWFLDILNKKLGFLDDICAAMYAKVLTQVTLYADHEKLQVQTLPVVAYLGYQELLLDNEVHVMQDPPPLFQFIEPPRKLYKARHFMNAAGSYNMQWLIWYRYSDISSVNELVRRKLDNDYICIYTEGTVQMGQLNILKRVFQTKQDVCNISLESWKKNDHEDLVGEVTMVYLPKQT